jgi:hypothetical protein
MPTDRWRELIVRQHLLTTLILALLVSAVFRLAALNQSELTRLRSARLNNSTVPTAGSLSGFGSGGPIVRDESGAAIVVAFVVRTAAAELDKAYWNAVLQATPAATHSADWWGVCDAGSNCRSIEESALFTLVEYIDPIQAKAMATSGVDTLALVYKGSTLVGRVTKDADPSVTAGQIAPLLQ